MPLPSPWDCRLVNRFARQVFTGMSFSQAFSDSCPNSCSISLKTQGSEFRSAQRFVIRLALAVGRFAFITVVAPLSRLHKQGQFVEVARHAAHQTAVQPVQTRIALREFVTLDSHA